MRRLRSAVVGSVAAAAFGCATGCTDERVAIGVSAGSELAPAARLAIEDAAERGVELELVTAPERASIPSQAIRVAEHFASVPNLIGVVAHSSSSASLAASQIYNRERIVQIAPYSSAAIYSAAGPYSFRLVPPDDEQGKFLARQIARTRAEGTRLALLWVNDDYGRGLRRALLTALDTTRYPVVMDLPHAQDSLLAGEPELLAARLERSRPDLVVWLARAAVLARVLPVIHDRAGEVPILAADALSTIRQFVPDSALRPSIQHADFLELDATPALRRFASRFQRQTGRQATPANALSYDAVSLFAAGRAAGAGTGPAMREYLLSLGRSRPPFDGITGEIVFDEDGDVRRSYVMRAVVPADVR